MFDDGMNEFSCDWRSMYTFFFSEISAVDDHSEAWVKENSNWAREMRLQTQTGQLDMMAAIERSVKAYADQYKEGIKLARRARIDKQLISLNQGKGINWDIKKDLGEGEERILETLAHIRQVLSHSDDESEEEDSEEDSEEEWEDLDEDEDEEDEE
jgi:hypothetical protein